MKWPPLVNVSRHQPTLVALHDGTEVLSDSEAWRAECEARYVLNLHSKSRRHAYLDGAAKKRGDDSRKALEDAVMALWRAERATAG